MRRGAQSCAQRETLVFRAQIPPPARAVVRPAALRAVIVLRCRTQRQTHGASRFLSLVQETPRHRTSYRRRERAAVLRPSSPPPLSTSPSPATVLHPLFSLRKRRTEEEEEEERPLPSSQQNAPEREREREREREFYSSLVRLRSSLGSERLAHVCQLRKIFFPRKVTSS